MEFWKALIISKEIKKPSDKIFERLGNKPIKIWNFWENSKMYMQKSQWKIDFLPIFLQSSTTFVILYTSTTFQNLGGRGW